MARTLTGSGFVDAVRRQKADAQAKLGIDQQAGAIPPTGAGYPFTTHAYALEVAKFWAFEAAPGAVQRSLQSGSGTSIICLAEAAKAIAMLQKGELPAPDDISVVGGCGTGGALAGGILRDLRAAYSAIIVDGLSVRVNSSGKRVMTASACRQFWDKVSSCANGCVSSRASVTSDEKWDSFLDGVQEGAHNVGEVIGEAAGFLGETVGEGLSGALEGLGLVNIVIVGAGLYVGSRIL